MPPLRERREDIPLLVAHFNRKYSAGYNRAPKNFSEEALDRLSSSAIASRAPAGLGGEAWRLADEFGWAKTYDAEYVALAQLLRCRLVTLDAALRRSTARLGFVVSPTEL